MLQVSAVDRLTASVTMQDPYDNIVQSSTLNELHQLHGPITGAYGVALSRGGAFVFTRP